MTDERLKLWLSFIKFVLGSFVIGLIALVIKASFQEREIEIKEQQQIGKFLDHALQQDIGVRRRFAQYFSKVTRSTEARSRWEEYYEVLNIEYKETIEEKRRLEAIAVQNNISKTEKELLEQQIQELRNALRPLYNPQYSSQFYSGGWNQQNPWGQPGWNGSSGWPSQQQIYQQQLYKLL